MRTQELKFGLYAHWQGNTAQIVNDQTLESELYDYSTAAGQAELDNLGNTNDPRIQALKQSLLGNLIPDVLRAPLPGALRVAQTASRVAYLAYDALLQNLQNNSCGGNSPSSTGDLPAQLPFGKDF